MRREWAAWSPGEKIPIKPVRNVSIAIKVAAPSQTVMRMSKRQVEEPAPDFYPGDTVAVMLASDIKISGIVTRMNEYSIWLSLTPGHEVMILLAQVKAIYRKIEKKEE